MNDDESTFDRAHRLEYERAQTLRARSSHPEVRRYVIWSLEHQAWWPITRHGYVETLAAAGRFSLTEALTIVAHANRVTTNECMIPVEALDPLALPTLADALDRAIDANRAVLSLLRMRGSRRDETS